MNTPKEAVENTDAADMQDAITRAKFLFPGWHFTETIAGAKKRPCILGMCPRRKYGFIIVREMNFLTKTVDVFCSINDRGKLLGNFRFQDCKYEQAVNNLVHTLYHLSHIELNVPTELK